MIKFLRRKIRHFFLSVNISYLRFYRLQFLFDRFASLLLFSALIFWVFGCFSPSLFYWGSPLVFLIFFFFTFGCFLAFGFFWSFVALFIYWLICFFGEDLVDLWGLLC